MTFDWYSPQVLVLARYVKACGDSKKAPQAFNSQLQQHRIAQKSTQKRVG